MPLLWNIILEGRKNILLIQILKEEKISIERLRGQYI
jgi:hypothetical protein